MSKFRHTIRFLKEFVRSPRATGAVAPSSRFLAKKMLDWMELETVETALEYGPGTGSFTSEILARRKPGARVLAVELNEGFVQALRDRHPELEVAHDSVENIRYICDQAGIAEADCVVSGLPWAVFPDDLQNRILDAMMTVLKPGGRFATFAYIHALHLPPAKKFRDKLEKHFSRVSASETVWLNFPPAICYQCVR
jgi:phospholipid N-methyltransferase